MLALPLIHMSPDRWPFKAVEFGIHVNDCLDVIIPGGEFPKTVQRISKRVAINQDRRTGFELLHIHTEKRRAALPAGHLEPRLWARLSCHDHENAPCDRFRMCRRCKRNLKS